MDFSSTKPRDLLPGFFAWGPFSLPGLLYWGLSGAAACQIEPRCKGVACAEFFVESARKMGLYKKGLYKMGLYKKGRKHLSFRQKKSAPNKKGGKANKLLQ